MTPHLNHHQPRHEPAGLRGRHIPREHFQARFGRTHCFRINRPLIVEGRPRFQFAGVSFGIAGLWPPAWSFADAVYVENINGMYFLLNPADPAVRVPVHVLG
jgi:hypothetical protein